MTDGPATGRPDGSHRARLHRRRSTKIVATLGPASETPEMAERLFEAGADIFRINMSHLPPGRLAERVRTLRALEDWAKRPIAILVDLQGPKFRIGSIEGDAASLVEGACFSFDTSVAPGDAKRVHLPHPEILPALQAGHAVLIDDGKLRLCVTRVLADRIDTRVEVGGMIHSRKGVSLPDTVIPVAAMTEKDHRDLAEAIEVGVDWIALSFVQRPEDVVALRKLVQGRAAILSKLEKPQALSRLEEIIEVSDAIMVARGDLGVEMPLEKVPGLQKRITRLARRRGKPVIIATQMLESMIGSPVPTRAEVSDVATAVFEGADAVMLSAETASGRYPVEAVTMMDRIVREVESDAVYRPVIAAQRGEPEATGPDAIAAAASQMAATLALKTIVAWSFSGATAYRMARERPSSAVLALTPNRDKARQLALAWGIHPIVTRDAHDIDDMAARACKFALREGRADPGDRIIVVAGIPFGTPGATNLTRIAIVTEQQDAKSAESSPLEGSALESSALER